jgi:hypothetical protein
MSASGSVAGAMVFSSSKGRPYVRQLVVPSNPNSDAQQGVRASMKGLNNLWASMDDNDKATWESAARQANVSTWNSFVARNQKDFANGMAAQRQDPAEASNPPSIPQTITDSVEGRQATINCLIPHTGETFGVMLWVSPTNNFVPAPANMKGIQPGTGTPDDPIQFVLSNLEPGTYYYRLRGFDYAGEFGVVSAQGDFVVS